MPKFPEKLPLIVALDNIRSLHNVGSIFRTADAVNAEKILLGGLTAVPPRFEIEKTALGATNTVAWEYIQDLKSALIALKAKGYAIYALEQTPSSVDLYTSSISFPLVLILGHERVGVSPEVLEVCDQHIHLPMAGKSAHSLNVSNAGAVSLYEVQRRFCYHDK